MLDTRIARQWDDDIVPQLIDYIRLPAKSPHFDHDWKKHGHIEASIRLAHAWACAQGIKGLGLEIVRLEGRTPVLYFDVPATAPGLRTSCCMRSIVKKRIPRARPEGSSVTRSP